MANYHEMKHISTSRDSYRNPFLYQPDYELYHPPYKFPAVNSYFPEKGTEKWFQDYHRTDVEEEVLRKNLTTFPSSLKSTRYSDKSDRVLGARKSYRDSMFPELYGNPVYLLSNNENDKPNEAFMKEVRKHRGQMKNLTGSKHKIGDAFYFPLIGKETFGKRNKSPEYITVFPSHCKAGNF